MVSDHYLKKYSHNLIQTWCVHLSGGCSEFLFFSAMLAKFFEMIHKAWSNIEEVLYCFSMSSVKFQGHTGQKIADFDPNWAFPDCNSNLNSSMDLKWCTKLDVV